MRRLIYVFSMMFLIMPALTVEAGLSRNSSVLPVLTRGDVHLPASSIQTGDSHDLGGRQYAQNLDADLQPEAVNGSDQTLETGQPANPDGFEGGSTFDHFNDPRWAKDGDNGHSPAEYGGAGHEPADQSEIDYYNLMMKAWQKD